MYSKHIVELEFLTIKRIRATYSTTATATQRKLDGPKRDLPNKFDLYQQNNSSHINSYKHFGFLCLFLEQTACYLVLSNILQKYVRYKHHHRTTINKTGIGPKSYGAGPWTNLGKMINYTTVRRPKTWQCENTAKNFYRGIE